MCLKVEWMQTEEETLELRSDREQECLDALLQEATRHLCSASAVALLHEEAEKF